MSDNLLAEAQWEESCLCICSSSRASVPLLLHPSPSRHLSFTFALYSHFSLPPSHPSSSSPSASILPLPLSITIVTFISLTLCLFYFSLKEYIQDADKCDGPLAGSPPQAETWQTLFTLYKSTRPFSLLPFPLMQLEDIYKFREEWSFTIHKALNIWVTVVDQ